MIKQISITFDFNTETEEVSNVKTVGSAEKKTKTTKKVKEVEEEVNIATESIITLDSSKLSFNSKAVEELGLEPGSRVIIKWEKINKGKILEPIIGTDLSFDEEGAGNKVTKSNTIQFKGKSNLVLAERGTEFKLKPLREGIWQLISSGTIIENSDSEDSLLDTIEQAEEIEPMIIVDNDEVQEIEELGFEL